MAEGQPAHLGDARGEWYYCFKHKKVETNAECHEMDRMGPYPTREDAENWRERVAARNEAWGDEDWRNWRRRVFSAAAKRVGLKDVRPYDLRHSFVSLLIAEGRSIIDVARQAGHSATMTLDTYGHVFDELDGAEKVNPEQAIRAARNAPCDLGATSTPARVAVESNVIPLFGGIS